MKSEMCESQCKCMPEASGGNVATTEDTTAGSPEVSDIVASNSMDFLPVDQPHIKRDEDEGETTSESPDLGDTAASNPTENAPHDFALVCGQNDNLLHRFCSDSPFKYYCSSKGKIAKTQTNGFCDQFCSCKEIARSCFISPFLTPICLDVDSSANHSTKPAPVSKAQTITDMETGEVVGHLDSNGTAVYDDDYTTTGQ
jgi:hypothetical protein